MVYIQLTIFLAVNMVWTCWIVFAMMLIAVGENFKSIDKMTDSQFLEQYPEVNWRGVKGVRDLISHQYFNIDAEEIYYICNNDLEKLRYTVELMLQSVQNKKNNLDHTPSSS